MSDRGEYRAIRRVLLDGPDYQALSPEAKLVLLTLKIQLGPTAIDVVNGLAYALAEQTGYEPDGVMRALDQLERGRWIRRDRNVVWIVDGLRHEPSRKLSNTNHRQEIERHLDGLPRLPIVDAFRQHYGLPVAAEPAPAPNIPQGMGDGMGDGIPDGMGEHGRTEERKNGERRTDTPSAAGAAGAASGGSDPAPSRPARPPRPAKAPAVPTEGPVAVVLDHYRATHPRRRVGPKDARAVEKALALGYTSEELCQAIDGNAADEWHREKRKHELPYVLRDTGKIDDFRERVAAPTALPPGFDPNAHLSFGVMDETLDRLTAPPGLYPPTRRAA